MQGTYGIDSRITWSFYNRAVTSPDYYLLYYGGNSFTVIPRRAFHSEDDLNSFEALITAKFGANIVEVGR